MFLDLTVAADMPDSVAFRFQQVRYEAAMTAPPKSFRTHDAGAFVGRETPQTLDAAFELLCFHIIGVSTKGVIAPCGVRRIAAGLAAAPQLWKVSISNAGFSQSLGQRRQAELRVTPRTGKTTDVCHKFDFASPQQSNKFFQRQGGVANGPKLEPAAFSIHDSISNAQCKVQRIRPAHAGRRNPALPLMSEGSNFNALPRSFYLPSAEKVAPLLLGHFLFRNTPQGLAGGLIIETEAYLKNDPACHAAPGPTQRNRVMFGAPGHAYVYLIYGYHFCVNAVCQPQGIGEAVLIRAVEPTVGEDFMCQHRLAAKPCNMTNGPAKLCEAMKIERDLDGIDLCDPKAPLFIGENPKRTVVLKQLGPLVTTTRIGISKAAHLPLRFYLDGSEFVSRKERAERKRKW